MKILHGAEIYIAQSGYGPALQLERLLPRRSAGIIAFAAGVASAIGAMATLAFSSQRNLVYVLLGLTLIALAMFLGIGVFWLFGGYLRAPRVYAAESVKRAWEQEALGAILTFDAAALVRESAEGDNLVPVRFWNAITQRERFVWVWRRLDVLPATLRKKAGEAYPPAAAFSLMEVLRTAWQKALEANRVQVDDADIAAALCDRDKIFRDVIFEAEVEAEDFFEVAQWRRRHELDLLRKARFWSRENLLDTEGIGKDWSAGYTLNLDRTAIDLTANVEFAPPPTHLYGHRPQLELMERLLLRAGTGSNLVIVGEPGVGRHTLMRAFAAKVRRGETLGPFRFKRLLQIDTSAILGGTTNPNETLGKISLLFNEALLAENVILVINDIDAFFDPQPEVGRVNAAEALLPYLKSPLRVIGITTQGGYQATVGKNPQLQEIFSKLEVSEPPLQETLRILEDEAPRTERRTGVFFSFQALREIAALSQKLIQNIPNPVKAIELLEETAVYAVTNENIRVIRKAQVQRVVTIRTKVPVERVEGQEKDILLNLETVLHERVVGQDDAIRQIADAMRRARAGISSGKRPIGSFLFLGPTGVGKTETAKALAAVYFGSESRMVRLDMSEYQGGESEARLIGDPNSGTGGALTEAVIADPFSLVLLDEMEKANPKILDLFLQVLDDGRLTDMLGRTVSFANTMIIATSNAGAEFIREMERRGGIAGAREKILDQLQRQGIFKPEFLNRFDGVVIYQPLDEVALTEIAILLLREFNERLREREVQINITPELAKAVARGGYTAEFGARPLRRYIQEHIENYVARGLIAGDIKRGDMIEFPPNIL